MLELLILSVEGSWDEVMRLIGQAHTLVHQNGVLRVQSDVRIGTRTDKKQHFSEKVTKVESILAADNKPAEKKAVAQPAAAVEKKEGEAAAAPAPTKPKPLIQGTWASIAKK